MQVCAYAPTHRNAHTQYIAVTHTQTAEKRINCSYTQSSERLFRELCQVENGTCFMFPFMWQFSNDNILDLHGRLVFFRVRDGDGNRKEEDASVKKPKDILVMLENTWLCAVLSCIELKMQIRTSTVEIKKIGEFYQCWDTEIPTKHHWERKLVRVHKRLCVNLSFYLHIYINQWGVLQRWDSLEQQAICNVKISSSILACPIYILKASDIDNQKEMIYY